MTQDQTRTELAKAVYERLLIEARQLSPMELLSLRKAYKGDVPFDDLSEKLKNRFANIGATVAQVWESVG